MRELHGLFIWTQGKPGLAEPLSPDTLAQAHPLWHEGVEAFGPWENFSPNKADGTGSWLRSGRYQRPETVVVCGPCTSSLDVARYFLEQGILPQWGAVAALSQSRGRGRLRRAWDSPAGNLYAAWAWPVLGPEWEQIVSLLAGYVAAKVLEEMGLGIRVKWPNDLLWQDRKVGGILVEEKAGQTLVGVGLNLACAPKEKTLREPWSAPAACLDQAGIKQGPLGLLTRLVEYGIACYDLKVAGGTPKNFLLSLEQKLAWVGRKVLVRDAPEEYEARILGLSQDGGLMLQRLGGREVLYSGGVSLLPEA
ncbi:MAG: biotin--[acetyl-CoA-carboxylase] ligase [Thermodesulfobacteriota bacterium]|nr:biotin--[acetyl-CoA-carboxylase] ligase [Thermodesulfobacteriota bacterium]